MTLPIFPPSPPAPQRGVDSAAVFRDKADVFAAWWASLPEEMREFAAALTAAIGVANFTSASVTELEVGTGVMALTVDTGKMFVPGGFVMLADAAAPTTNRMYAEIVSYDFGTGAMVVNVERAWGGGSHAGWVVGLAGPQGVGSDTLPSFTGNANKVLALSADASATEWKSLGWNLITTLTPSGAPAVNVTSLKATPYNDLRILYSLTPAVGDSSVIQIEVSANGSAFSGGLSSGPGAIGTLRRGVFALDSFRDDQGLVGAGEIITASPALNPNAAKHAAWFVSGGIDAVRISRLAAGNVSGTVTVLGKI